MTPATNRASRESPMPKPLVRRGRDEPMTVACKKCPADATPVLAQNTETVIQRDGGWCSPPDPRVQYAGRDGRGTSLLPAPAAASTGNPALAEGMRLRDRFPVRQVRTMRGG